MGKMPKPYINHLYRQRTYPRTAWLAHRLKANDPPIVHGVCSPVQGGQRDRGVVRVKQAAHLGAAGMYMLSSQPAANNHGHGQHGGCYADI